MGAKDKNERLGTVGGQAVMEGVMMKNKENIAIAVRQLDGGVVVRTSEFISLRKKYKFCRIPVIRGIVNFIETMKMSMSTLTASAEMMGFEEEEPGKFEKWLDKTFGKSIMAFVSAIGMILGVALAVFLFMYLPALVVNLIGKTGLVLGGFRSAVEGVIKIGIFILYLFLVSLIPDIKRVFKYHGAEHKTVFCYESGEELTVENARSKSRFHPRCGTSFMFVILILSIITGSIVSWDILWIRVVLKILMLPLVVGVGFEYIMYAGKHDNVLTRILSAPGLWMQRITTSEPDDSMLEVAITSLKASMPAEFPDFVIPRETDKEKTEQPGDQQDTSAFEDNGSKEAAANENS